MGYRSVGSLGESGVRSRHAYLLEEVFAQGLTRNVAAFARCFEAVGYSHGQFTNYTNIARDCGVDAKTVREYYQILCDTLPGRMVLPYRKRQDRRVLSRTPKFFLFDVGVAGALVRRRIAEPRGEQFGHALQHFILMEWRRTLAAASCSTTSTSGGPAQGWKWTSSWAQARSRSR